MENVVNENKIKLKDSETMVTLDPKEYYTVLKGEAFVYIQFTEGEIVDRSLYLCAVPEGESIPSLSCALPDTENKWHFMIKPNVKAVLSRQVSEDGNMALGKEFADGIEGIPDPEEEDYQKRFVKWYIDTIVAESRKIEKMRDQKQEAEEDNLDLMKSLFSNKHVFKYDSNSPSLLYNSVNILCEYLNVPILPYQDIYGICGENFTVQDIARLSRFIVRKVTLTKDWYKKESGAFLSFIKDTKDPVLCIPRGGNKFLMYNIKEGTEKVVEEEEAAEVEEAYIIYEHFSKTALKLKDVYLYGMRKIKTKDIVLFLLMYLLSTLVGLLMPLLNERIYDELIPLGQRTPVFQVGQVIFVCMIGNLFFGMVQSLSNMRGIKSMEYSIVSATFDRVFKLPESFIEQFGTSELVNRVSSVMGLFSQTLISGVTAVMGFVLSIFYLWKMFSECKPLAWRGLIMALISAVVMAVFSYLRISKERENLEASTKANGLLYQFMSGIQRIKVSGIENRSLYEFQKANSETMKYEMRSTRISNVGTVFTSIMTVCYSGVIYYTVVKKSQTLTIGEYSAFNSAYGMFTSAIGQLVSFFITVAGLIPVMNRLKPIFNQECEASGFDKIVKKLEGEIEVSHLSFSYKKDENYVLRDVNMKIERGEFIGICGPSGCGKSTLLKLLLGFEEPTKGNIFFDNRDITTLDKTSMRHQMGVVLQDGRMIMGNIYTNITLSNPEMDPVEVDKLLKVVGLAEDVDQMPMGMFTAVSEGGGTLSGGQQQRVLIARALANNPKILLFDEATSALDNITQQTVCENIAAGDMTRIMIAHRLSTVKNCDRIFVIDNGQIAEVGNYEELMKKKGLFYTLVKRQQLGNDI